MPIMMKNSDNSINLRSIKRDDASVLQELNNNEEIAKCVVGNPKKVNIEEQLLWIDTLNKEKNTIRMMIEYENFTVGTVIISEVDIDNATGNLAIKILPQFQGKGIGTEALTLACEYAFGEMDLYCVTAHILADNYASLKLFEKIGFSKEGILRSRVVKEEQRKDLVSLSRLKSEKK
ncbi:MAG: GNAT family N-acetyltransferase [Dorea sp.]|jgi:RimJ/RimL family protein N-acetyltransferase|nr:GNAT family N-acetyltransferase [Dorea sp.]